MTAPARTANVPRDEALIVALHLLRAELRRPELADLLEHYFDRYRFSDHDRRTLEAAARSQAWITNYLIERGVAETALDDEGQALVRGAIITLEKLRLDQIRAKRFTDLLGQPSNAAPDSRERKP